MINREIVYERNVSRSYMKIPAVAEASFDEKMMLKKHLPGLLPVEKCFVNGVGQYWYNISGKQALDTYCKMKTIGASFIEKMILSICSQFEILEWNLINMNCLVLDPELIFIGNGSEEIVFTVYPGSKHEVFSELQQLMEYLLTKVDHKDKDAVHAAYEIYEMTLNESYSIMDIKDAILDARGKAKEDKTTDGKSLITENNSTDTQQKEAVKIKRFTQEISTPIPAKQETKRSVLERIKELWNKWKGLLEKTPAELIPKIKKSKKAAEPEIVYPTEPQEEELSFQRPEIHPTICLSQAGRGPRGMLMYEGREHYPDFQIGELTCTIGKGEGVQLLIDKETISRFHAKIECLEHQYYIEDLNSTNGTFVNEEALLYKKQKQLKENDVIRFADVRYRFM
uniref:DUF6382 domain-containing protein n=1 Tax=Agathobacter sp. TaxID=2021311 RepID=UPI004055E14D